ncbi:autotransporter domain-containing protein [Microvirga sp. M2]|uniref:autotransporter outer membrane beta-barrel domain-containing protein n=1 Tax=Microvirga sp. M2 TaxID=3073270 RepID=UPI0039C1A530
MGANGSNGGDAAIRTEGPGGAGGTAGDGSFTSGAGGTGGRYRRVLPGAGSGPEGGATGTDIEGGGNGGGPDSGGGGGSGDSGGGGGGGGGRGATVTSILSNSGIITGGNGGNGGNGARTGDWSGGGGGGGGGNGVVLTGTAITNAGTVTGGNGGNGGRGDGLLYGGGDDGTGGTGGVGVLVQTTTGATIDNSGTIAGGVGGIAGGWGSTQQREGGDGIRGENLTVINSGTIAGGDGSNAITFTGGTNVLELRKGYSFTGTIAGDGTDTLRLGGVSDAGFNLATLGNSAQFQHFEELEKTGASTWTATGTSDFAGPTAVQSGRLAVNGSLANSIVTVANGAILSGGGTIGGLVVRTGASVRPGNSIGTLTVHGNVSFAAGSTYQVEANAASQSDHIVATGTATLAGGTVQVLAENGVYLPSTTYTILTASGGVTDTFDTVTSNFAFLAPSLGYDANHVFLTLERKTVPTDPTDPPPLAFTSVAATRNQYNVAGAAEALGAGHPVFDAVLGQSVAGARQAFDALSGEVHASAVTSAYGDAREIRNTVLGRLRQPVGSPATVAAAFAADLPGVAPLPAPVPVPTLDPRRFALWGAAFGSWGKVDRNGNAAGMDTATGRFAIGADATFDQAYRIGIAGGFTRTTFDIDGRRSSGSNESVFGALYGSGTWGGLNLRLGTSYAVHDIDTSRRVVFPGFSDDLRASYNGWTAQAFGELGYRFEAGVAVLEPFVGASILRLHTDSFGEAGGAAALTGFARGYDLGTTTVGLRAEAQVSPELPLTVRGLLGWQHAYGDVRPESLLAFAGGTSVFTVAGVPVDWDALVAEAGLNWQASDALSLGVSYSGQIGEHAQEHSVKGNLVWKFDTH